MFISFVEYHSCEEILILFTYELVIVASMYPNNIFIESQKPFE